MVPWELSRETPINWHDPDLPLLDYVFNFCVENFRVEYSDRTSFCIPNTEQSG